MISVSNDKGTSSSCFFTSLGELVEGSNMMSYLLLAFKASTWSPACWKFHMC